MAFKLFFSEQAISDMGQLKSDPSLNKRLNAVRKALAYLQLNPRHPSLNTHKYTAIDGPNGGYF